MDFEVSVYLDLIRFVASFTVFAGHIAGERLTGGFLWQFAPYMGPAVTIFFVLSGYVIGFVTAQRENNAAIYAINRLSRMYSVAIPAIILTLFLDYIGKLSNPGLYSAGWGYHDDNAFFQVLSAITFTQKIFGSDMQIGSDLPYWSLNYEVFYYLIYGLVAYCPGRVLRAGLAAAAALAAGKAVMLLFPLWLLGFSLVRLRPWTLIGKRTGWILVAGSVFAFAVYEGWAWRTGRILAAAGPASRPEIVQDYLMAGLFAANLTGVHAVSSSLTAVASKIAQPVKWLAARTFALYLFHLPIAQFLAALNPLPPSHPASRLLICAGTLALSFWLAGYTELRKNRWRRAIQALLHNRAAQT